MNVVAISRVRRSWRTGLTLKKLGKVGSCSENTERIGKEM
jgi:hypothetical protein